MGAYVEHSTWDMVREKLVQGFVPVLPVAAACKEHGFHMPMNTDQLQIDWLLSRVMHRNILAWPALTYGYYPAFKNYAGSVTLSRKTFVAVVSEIVDGIFIHGADRLIILNSGISTISPLVELSLSQQYLGRVHLCNIYHGQNFIDAERKVSEQGSGGHADEIETSIMLVASHSRVNMSLAHPSSTRVYSDGPLQAADPVSPNYSESGVMGNPVLANAEKGRILTDAMCRDVDHFIQHVVQSRQKHSDMIDEST